MPIDPRLIELVKGSGNFYFPVERDGASVPLWASRYTNSVLRSRALWQQRLSPRVVQLLHRAFSEMLVGFYESAGAGKLTADRADDLARSLRAHLARLEIQLATITGDGALAAAGIAANGHAQGVRQTVGVQAGIETSFTQVPAQALDLMQIRRFAESEAVGHSQFIRTLYNRRVNSAENFKVFDDLIRQFVIEGRSWTDSTRDIAGLLAKGDSALMQEMVSHLGARGGKLRNEISQSFWADLNELAKQDEFYAKVIGDTKLRAQTILYDGRRIAISEVNIAHFEADRLAAETSPVVQAVTWNLSGRHASIGIACECDVLANADYHGLGTGVYYAENCPSRPHPFCGCTLGYVLRAPADWNKAKDTPRRPIQLSESTIEDFLNQANEKARSDKTLSITPKRIDRVLENVNGLTRKAHSVWAGRLEEVAA
jgi:hypothetical protein